MEEARGIAARIWCEEQHSHKEMDAELAESLARLLAEKNAEIERLRGELVRAAAIIAKQLY